MKIIELYIEISPDEKNPSDAGMSHKVMHYASSTWAFQGTIFPRDVRFLAEVQELMDRYNKP